MLHIDLPMRSQIDQLARYRGSPAVSIFLRTTPVTQEAQADRIELKNLPYPHTASAVIAGSADDTADHVLAAEARKILDKIYAGEIQAFKDLYETRSAHGRATSDVAEAARAATFGAIDTLIVDMDASVSGHLADEDGAVTFDAEPDGVNSSVLDEIARRALASGARVIAVRSADLPAGGHLAAILRYPI